MLHSIKLIGVGPADSLELDLQPRVNLIVGDNGLGKTFLLDVAWWILGRSWPSSYQALPRRGAREAKIEYVVDIKTAKKKHYSNGFDRPSQQWKRSGGRPPSPGLVLYARADGGFSIWDPARNYWRDSPSLGVSDPTRPDAYHFTQREVWDGLRQGDRVLCNGLIADWVNWQAAQSPAFTQLMASLGVLSEPGETLTAGVPVRISLDDARDIPTLRFRYGDVPIVHASAGVKRIVALAYLLVWAFDEHQKACELLGRTAEQSVIFLIDEIEAHLHPRWQRVVLPALLDVVDKLTPSGANVQILAASHAPLLLASLEPRFDPEQDRIIHFDVKHDKVIIDTSEFAQQGDATNWLVSEFFGLKQARSREAEEAIEAAEAWMRSDRHVLPAHLSTSEQIDAELRRTVPGHDPFWPRWILTRGAEPKRPARKGSSSAKKKGTKQSKKPGGARGRSR
ncbi:AAA family ATPase [Enhygromyxa salina]|uniref:DNA replication and repair protein RecF n=1 Tax=Enhygromyxa salina TaxID=215803 RepID=A0A2S9XTE3_9BACT|nr:ATP-binding protein [Enhygromyxa salina]PRP96113.1 DNA replication and repair protein RecF [Enhygromyxa salina]